MGDCNVEVYSRVTGFCRPVQQWNEGKKEEFKDRKKYGGINGGTKLNFKSDSKERDNGTGELPKVSETVC